jgi:hypothetical protein
MLDAGQARLKNYQKIRPTQRPLASAAVSIQEGAPGICEWIRCTKATPNAPGASIPGGLARGGKTGGERPHKIGSRFEPLRPYEAPLRAATGTYSRQVMNTPHIPTSK